MIREMHVSSRVPNQLLLEPWAMPEFYNKQRQPRSHGGPPLCSIWTLKPEMVEWLAGDHGLLNPQVFLPDVVQWDLYGSYELNFRSHGDLLLFKLRWGGA